MCLAFGNVKMYAFCLATKTFAWQHPGGMCSSRMHLRQPCTSRATHGLVLCRADKLAQTAKWLEDKIQDLKAETKAVEVQHNSAQAEADDKLKALTDENSLLKNRCIAFVVSWICQCQCELTV